MKRIIQTTALAVAGLLVVLLALEGMIRLYGTLRTQYSSGNAALFLPDPRLGHKPNPLYPGHDASGWRNAKAMDHAEIVALGDSQTYGLNVEIENAWPQTMAKLLGVPVYQMAFGGYGPVHYAQLIDDALILHPRVIIAAFYFGNDVLDAYWQAYNIKPDSVKHTQGGKVVSQFRTEDIRVVERLEAAERIDPRHVRHGYLDCQSPRFVPHPDLQVVEHVMDLQPLDRESPQMLITQHSVLYQTVQSKLQLLMDRWGLSGEKTDYGAPWCIPYDDGRVRTTFTPAYRLLTLTATDPRVVEGVRISLQAFNYMARRSSSAGVRFIVAFIPTKEYVFRKFAIGTSGEAGYMKALWAAEGAVRREIFAYLEQNRIEVVDLLPALENMISHGENPYKQAVNVPREDGDGHPVAGGYHAIAMTIARQIEPGLLSQGDPVDQ